FILSVDTIKPSLISDLIILYPDVWWILQILSISEIIIGSGHTAVSIFFLSGSENASKIIFLIDLSFITNQPSLSACNMPSFWNCLIPICIILSSIWGLNLRVRSAILHQRKDIGIQISINGNYSILRSSLL